MTNPAEPWPDFYTLVHSWGTRCAQEGAESDIDTLIDTAKDMVALGHDPDVVATIAGDLYRRFLKDEVTEWLNNLEDGDGTALRARAENAKECLEGSLFRFVDVEGA